MDLTAGRVGAVAVGFVIVLWLLAHHRGGQGGRGALWQDCPLDASGLERSSSGAWVHPVRPDQVGKPDTVAVIPVSPLTDNLEDFLVDLKALLDENQITQRPVQYVFSSNTSVTYPFCQGQWLEFGVAGGATTRWMAKYREAVCGSHPDTSGATHTGVVGFDTFTGLPEAWGAFKEGHFNLKGKLPPVPANVQLVKGLFNESLPPFLEQLDRDSRHRPAVFRNVTYLHIDCDLYAGARDALSLLSDRIHPGAILVFDDLLAYPTYREHEVLALWQWLHASQRRLQIIGIFGPLSGRADAVDLNPARDLGYFRQSVAFVVL